MDINDLRWFLAVSKEMSFTKAAKRLGIAQSTLSRTIGRLEADLGLRLLVRTTRNVALTEYGERLAELVGNRLNGIEADIDELKSLRDKPAGTVRLTLSDHALTTIVWPKLRPVLKQYPDIKLELSCDNGFRNLIEDGFDAGVRLGESLEKDMVAVRIGPDWRLVAIASPDYLRTHSTPVHPQDLAIHQCINVRQLSSGGMYVWEFAKDGVELNVRVDGQLTVNNGQCMMDAVVNGYGIAYLPEDVVAGHVQRGEVQVILDDWSPAFAGYHLYYPSKKQHSAAFSIIAGALRSKG